MKFEKSNTPLFTLEDERVVVLGGGRSGVAAANLAVARGAEVRLFDSRSEFTPVGLDPRVELVFGATPELGSTVHSDYLVISPGIDTYGDLVKSFQRHTTELMGELELGFRFYSGTCIGITGTNGKTTTTELVTHLLQGLGKDALSCGNHGTPLSELILTGAPEYAVVELSSFQLETISTFRSKVSLWLNLAPDHLDRYPDMAAYRAAKERIFSTLTPEDWKVTRQEEGFTFAHNQVTFSTLSKEADYTLQDGLISCLDGSMIDLSETRLRGRHNVENVMAAVAAVNCLQLPWTREPAEILQDFTPPEHRCELVRSLNGVEYINDSKSTNIHSLETALEAFDRPLILIIGGKDKGLEFDALQGRLAKNVKLCLTIGEIGEDLAQLYASEVDTLFCSGLSEAVQKAQSGANQGDYVLFSPGTSSFDMFPNYMKRGEAFKDAVEHLT